MKNQVRHSSLIQEVIADNIGDNGIKLDENHNPYIIVNGKKKIQLGHGWTENK